MDSRTAWSTKEEVLRDLAKATGRKVGDLDEDYLVIGARPPPRHVIEDEEAELLFGDALKSLNGTQLQGNAKKPDLRGITEMLRMVNEYTAEGDVSANNDALHPNDTVITISKLNPDVKEFIPKSATTSSPPSSVQNENIINNIKVSNNDKTECIDTGKILDVDLSKTSINNDKKIFKSNDIHGKISINNDKKHFKSNDIDSSNTSNDNDEQKNVDIKALADVLKSKITDASKSDTFENKRRKNVAISALLKLYATKLPSPDKKAESSASDIKLMTPQDFECPKKSDTNHNSATDYVTKTDVISAELPPSTSSISIIINGHETTANSDDKSSSSPIRTETPKTESSVNNVNDSLNREVIASIDKVNKWFDEPVIKKKAPSICLGPISFKRKDCAIKSPFSDTVQTTSKSPQTVCGQYKPSNYALDLGKKYMERSAIKENAQKNPWADLHEILKEKDVEIMKQRREREASSNSQMSTTSTD